MYIEAGVAQSVEQLIRNQQVGGSIPLAGIYKQWLTVSPTVAAW
jgi:hypothetical protein